MPVTYLKTFYVFDTCYGIEDQEQPGDHFFPDNYKNGSRKRFSLWFRGCGIGQFDTLKQAEKALKQKIEREIQAKIYERKQVLKLLLPIDKAIKKYGIKMFEVK